MHGTEATTPGLQTRVVAVNAASSQEKRNLKDRYALHPRNTATTIIDLQHRFSHGLSQLVQGDARNVSNQSLKTLMNEPLLLLWPETDSHLNIVVRMNRFSNMDG